MYLTERIVVTGLFLLAVAAMAAGTYQLIWTVETLAGVLS